MTRPRELHHVPGDKSITHRALLLAGLAPGSSTIHRPLTSLDARSTAAAIRALGGSVSPLRPGVATVSVVGNRLQTTAGIRLDCGNSGTTARLLLGVLAGRPGPVRLTGDQSLRRRPMRRVTAPLTAMGAVFPGDPATLPLSIIGGSLRPLEWHSPVASAQIKSAILLAGVTGEVPVTIVEPFPSRDHTERMLAAAGYRIETAGGAVRFEPTGELAPFEITIPGDPSSAAFLVAAALLGRGGSVRIAGVGLNPTRTGFLEVLRRMGARIHQDGLSEQSGEPMGDLVVEPGALRATTVVAAEVPSLIDEVPVLACLAARAEGESRFLGLAELRVKESDRLQLLATNLRAIGVVAEVSGDDLIVMGSDRPLQGRVITDGDHRIAMAFAVLGRGNRLTIDDPECAAVSFPGFAESLAAIEEETA